MALTVPRHRAGSTSPKGSGKQGDSVAAVGELSSLAALAEYAQPPLTKDTLHGRIRRLLALTEQAAPRTRPRSRGGMRS